MTNEIILSRLPPEYGEWANALYLRVSAELEQKAGENPQLLHLLRRRVSKKLIYEERSTPMQRKALKLRKMREQKGLCTICNEPLPANGYHAVLDREVAHLGYTDANVGLIHASCDRKIQEQRGYA